MKTNVRTKNDRRQHIVARKRRKRVTEALAAASVIAAGTQAYAAPVRFDNPPHGEPGHFHWLSAGPFTAHYLDITRPAAEQPGGLFENLSFAHTTYALGGQVYSYPYFYLGGLQATGVYACCSQLLGFNAGDVIPNPSGECYFGSDPFCFSPRGVLDYGGFDFPEGVAVYLGTRAGGNYCSFYGTCQYGWIGVVRTGEELEAFAWGYESDLEVPVCAGASAADPNCEGGEPIPTVSEWGLGIMGLLGLAAGTIVFGKRTGRAGEVAL